MGFYQIGGSAWGWGFIHTATPTAAAPTTHGTSTPDTTPHSQSVGPPASDTPAVEVDTQSGGSAKTYLTQPNTHHTISWAGTWENAKVPASSSGIIVIELRHRTQRLQALLRVVLSSALSLLD